MATQFKSVEEVEWEAAMDWVREIIADHPDARFILKCGECAALSTVTGPKIIADEWVCLCGDDAPFFLKGRYILPH